jgi:hypothetical protein
MRLQPSIAIMGRLFAHARLPTVGRSAVARIIDEGANLRPR